MANYMWQVPYYLYFYGRFAKSPGGLTVPLLLTFAWFLVGAVLLVNRRRGGAPIMASFLAVETLLYLVHNLTGAAGHDLPTHDPVLFLTSLLGYVNASAAILFLGWLLRARGRAQPGQRPADCGSAVQHELTSSDSRHGCRLEVPRDDSSAAFPRDCHIVSQRLSISVD